MRRLLGFGVNIYLALLAIYLLLRGLFGDGFWWLSLLNTFAYAWFTPLAVLMPLALVLRHKQAAWRLMPVLALGGLWYAPYYLRRPVDVPAGKVISVVAANVWGHNHDLSRVENWLRTADADLAILQEISPSYTTTTLPGLLDMYPYQASAMDDHRWGGNITLSRYPILSREYVDLGLPKATFPLRVVIDVQGQPVAVYNIHLAWPGGTPRLPLPRRLQTVYMQVLLGFDDDMRNQEIQRLLQHLETEPYPYIVAGDFNTSDQSATYGQIAVHMTDSFKAVGTGFAGSWPVSTARGLPGFLPPLIRIDYIWHSAAFRALDAHIGPAIGSDHLPVRATLTLSDAVRQINQAGS